MKMTLCDCSLGDVCKIVRCESQDSALKDRLMSFGIVKDKICKVMRYSLGRLAVAIMIDGTQVALRDSEARLIVVEPLRHEPN
ncbi:FeoA family protein [Helicobacter jaachi]|nr:FeoA family protein [Helicobacter jaachi]